MNVNFQMAAQTVSEHLLIYSILAITAAALGLVLGWWIWSGYKAQAHLFRDQLHQASQRERSLAMRVEEAEALERSVRTSTDDHVRQVELLDATIRSLREEVQEGGRRLTTAEEQGERTREDLQRALWDLEQSRVANDTSSEALLRLESENVHLQSDLRSAAEERDQLLRFKEECQEKLTLMALQHVENKPVTELVEDRSLVLESRVDVVDGEVGEAAVDPANEPKALGSKAKESKRPVQGSLFD
ncbi:MAG: hypothetical protein FJ405_14900 [Verrucomicrobia bacterium]|nr:hypothetical protein [Verrucomicrobiota bacterium]